MNGIIDFEENIMFFKIDFDNKSVFYFIINCFGVMSGYKLIIIGRRNLKFSINIFDF